jgi:hypothetical protein
MLSLKTMGFEKGIKDLRFAKSSFDALLLEKDYSPIRALEVTLVGPASIAATGAIMPDVSLDGQRLQDLSDLGKRMDLMAFGCDITPTNSVVLFVFRHDQSAASRFVESIQGLSTIQMPEFIGQFFFGFCENTYFSQRWWDSLSDTNKSFVTRLAEITDPYTDSPIYDLSRVLMPWREVSRRLIQ